MLALLGRDRARVAQQVAAQRAAVQRGLVEGRLRLLEDEQHVEDPHVLAREAALRAGAGRRHRPRARPPAAARPAREPERLRGVCPHVATSVLGLSPWTGAASCVKRRAYQRGSPRSPPLARSGRQPLSRNSWARRRSARWASGVGSSGGGEPGRRRAATARRGARRRPRQITAQKRAAGAPPSSGPGTPGPAGCARTTRVGAGRARPRGVRATGGRRRATRRARRHGGGRGGRRSWGERAWRAPRGGVPRRSGGRGGIHRDGVCGRQGRNGRRRGPAPSAGGDDGRDHGARGPERDERCPRHAAVGCVRRRRRRRAAGRRGRRRGGGRRRPLLEQVEDQRHSSSALGCGRRSAGADDAESAHTSVTRTPAQPARPTTLADVPTPVRRSTRLPPSDGHRLATSGRYRAASGSDLPTFVSEQRQTGAPWPLMHEGRPWGRPSDATGVRSRYLISTLPPASSMSDLSFRPPRFDAFLTGFGASSTRALASLRPRPVAGADDLDDLDLLVAGAGDDDVEGGLLLLGLGASPPAAPPAAGRRRRRPSRDAEGLLEGLDALGELEDGDALELFDPIKQWW